MKSDIMKEMESNIISWYDFESNSKILFKGNRENGAYTYLKGQYKNVDFFQEEKQMNPSYYDYLVILEDNINNEQVLEIEKYLKDTGILLIAFSNPYGISKFVGYQYKDRKSLLEKEQEKQIIKSSLEKALKVRGYSYSNLYMPFPNWKRTDVILTDKLEDLPQKIEKYFVDYENETAIITDEITLLKNIATYDRELFIKLSNSYLLEISKEPILAEVKYVSFNNYRKKEYQLTTIIKDKIVEKRPTTKEAVKNINRIAKNIKQLKKFHFSILDKFENNRLYSELIENRPTLDIELAQNYKNQEFIIDKLEQIKNRLLENSIGYHVKDKKDYPLILRNQKEEILEKFHYLEYAFYDMVPKNCFCIEDEYYFFDQEWMEPYLPVEFILYRSIINSYDLVRNICVNELLEKMGLLEYQSIFEELDVSLREKIVEQERLQELNKDFVKMYEILYQNELLKRENEDYKRNDEKQNEYIKALEARLESDKKEEDI